jgi:hypothetical protein
MMLSSSMTEKKSSDTVNKATKVVPFDKVNCELFYPDREENKDTTCLVTKMAVEVAQCLLKELRDPKKATSDYLSSNNGEFSWGNTTEDDHESCLGKMATNDPAEAPFAALTRQMEQFGRILGIHASGVGQARINGDFDRDLNDGNSDGAYYQLPVDMRASLVGFALSAAPEIHNHMSAAEKRQRCAKLTKREMLRKRKLVAAQGEYANALTYLDVYYSSACWKDVTMCKKEFASLGSKTAKLAAVKEQLRIRTVGLGWTDLHHPWSKNGEDYSPEYLRDYLIKTVIPEQDKRKIPKEPPVDLPSRGKRQQLGTETADVARLDKRRADQEKSFRREGKKLRDNLEKMGNADRYEKMQPSRPKVDESFVNARIEQYWEFNEKNGKVVGVWCKGVVVGVLKNNHVHIEWDKQYLRPGELEVSKERLLVSFYNKHKEEGWRMNLDCK